jgi:hypothetical protein
MSHAFVGFFLAALGAVDTAVAGDEDHFSCSSIYLHDDADSEVRCTVGPSWVDVILPLLGVSLRVDPGDHVIVEPGAPIPQIRTASPELALERGTATWRPEVASPMPCPLMPPDEAVDAVAQSRPDSAALAVGDSLVASSGSHWIALWDGGIPLSVLAFESALDAVSVGIVTQRESVTISPVVAE